MGASQGFSRKYRLTAPEEFRFVSRRGRRLGNACFTLLYCRNDLGYPRLGLAIARRHVGNAPHRNLVKRIIREAFRRHRDRLGSYDMVFIARPALAQKKNKRELHVMVDKLLRKLEQCEAS